MVKLNSKIKKIILIGLLFTNLFVFLFINDIPYINLIANSIILVLITFDMLLLLVFHRMSSHLLFRLFLFSLVIMLVATYVKFTILANTIGMAALIALILILINEMGDLRRR